MLFQDFALLNLNTLRNFFFNNKYFTFFIGKNIEIDFFMYFKKKIKKRKGRDFSHWLNKTVHLPTDFKKLK